jgi:hypothetical protein
MEKRQQVFEEWDVDCNDCKHYWDDTCDACSEGSRKLCNSFVATRRVVLPAKIERLESAVRGLKTCVILLTIVSAMLSLAFIAMVMT